MFWLILFIYIIGVLVSVFGFGYAEKHFNISMFKYTDIGDAILFGIFWPVMFAFTPIFIISVGIMKLLQKLFELGKSM